MSTALKGCYIIDSVETDDWKSWKMQLEGALIGQDLDKHLRPLADGADSAVKPKDTYVAMLIASCMTPRWQTVLRERLEAEGKDWIARNLWATVLADHKAHEENSGPLYTAQFEQLLPQPGQSIRTFVDEYQTAAQRLARVGRTRTQSELQDGLFFKIEQARPAWQAVLMSVRGNITKATKLTDIRDRLSELETRIPALSEHGEQALAAQSLSMKHFQPPVSPPVSPEVAILMKGMQELQMTMKTIMEAQASSSGRGGHQQQAGHGGNGRPGGQGPWCYNCGERGHKQWNCPNPKRQGQPSPPSCYGATTTRVALVSDWIVDSGATSHMSPGGGGNLFTNYRSFKIQQPVRFGKRGSMAYAIGIGDIAVWGATGGTVLTGVLHVPDLAGNLYSVKSATGLGYSVLFTPESDGSRLFITQKDGSTVLTGALRGCGMYTLQMGHHACAAHADSNALELAQLWHRRLGHAAFGTLAAMARKGLLGACSVTPAEFLQARDRAVCEPCVLGKMPRSPHPERPEPRTTRVLHRVHTDVLCVGVPAAGHGGALYAVSLVDEASGYARVRLIARKDCVKSELPRLIAWYETQAELRLQRLRCDQGGEFMDGTLQTALVEKGVQVELTATNAHQSNGVAERFNRTMLDKVRSMLADAGMPTKWWGDALIYACDLHNCLLRRGSSAVPHEVLLGRRPDISQFRIFGCRAWVHVPDKTGRHKLDARARRGRFLGFQQPMGSGVYRVLLDDGRITNSRTVVFDEPTVSPPTPDPAPPPTPPPSQGAPMYDDDPLAVTQEQELDAGEPVVAPEPAVAPDPVDVPAPEQWPDPNATGTAVPQTHVGRARRHNAGLPPDRFAYSALPGWAATRLSPITEEPRSRHRRRRDRRRRDRHHRRLGRHHRRAPKVSASVQTPCALGAGLEPPPPRSVTEALARSDATEWQKAIDEEVNSCLKHEVWVDCDLPPGKQALPSRFIFERKRDGRYKARLVAGGHRQRHGLDYEDTYAPTCAYRTMRMLLAV